MTHEVYSDGADIALSVCVVSEPQQQTGFAHARVANQKQLEQVIAACKTTSAAATRAHVQEILTTRVRSDEEFHSSGLYIPRGWTGRTTLD
jgi:hypothetical protein